MTLSKARIVGDEDLNRRYVELVQQLEQSCWTFSWRMGVYRHPHSEKVLPLGASVSGDNGFLLFYQEDRRDTLLINSIPCSLTERPSIMVDKLRELHTQNRQILQIFSLEKITASQVDIVQKMSQIRQADLLNKILVYLKLRTTPALSLKERTEIQQAMQPPPATNKMIGQLKRLADGAKDHFGYTEKPCRASLVRASSIVEACLKRDLGHPNIEHEDVRLGQLNESGLPDGKNLWLGDALILAVAFTVTSTIKPINPVTKHEKLASNRPNCYFNPTNFRCGTNMEKELIEDGWAEINPRVMHLWREVQRLLDYFHANTENLQPIVGAQPGISINYITNISSACPFASCFLGQDTEDMVVTAVKVELGEFDVDVSSDVPAQQRMGVEIDRYGNMNHVMLPVGFDDDNEDTDDEASEKPMSEPAQSKTYTTYNKWLSPHYTDHFPKLWGDNGVPSELFDIVQPHAVYAPWTELNIRMDGFALFIRTTWVRTVSAGLCHQLHEFNVILVMAQTRLMWDPTFKIPKWQPPPFLANDFVRAKERLEYVRKTLLRDCGVPATRRGYKKGLHVNAILTKSFTKQEA